MRILADAPVPGIAIAERVGDGRDGAASPVTACSPPVRACPEARCSRSATLLRRSPGSLLRIDAEGDDREVPAGPIGLPRHCIGEPAERDPADVRAMVQHGHEHDRLAPPIARSVTVLSCSSRNARSSGICAPRFCSIVAAANGSNGFAAAPSMQLAIARARSASFSASRLMAPPRQIDGLVGHNQELHRALDWDAGSALLDRGVPGKPRFRARLDGSRSPPSNVSEPRRRRSELARGERVERRSRHRCAYRPEHERDKTRRSRDRGEEAEERIEHDARAHVGFFKPRLARSDGISLGSARWLLTSPSGVRREPCRPALSPCAAASAVPRSRLASALMLAVLRSGCPELSPRRDRRRRSGRRYRTGRRDRRTRDP